MVQEIELVPGKKTSVEHALDERRLPLMDGGHVFLRKGKLLEMA